MDVMKLKSLFPCEIDDCGHEQAGFTQFHINDREMIVKFYIVSVQ